jgi:hypothetical protein
MSQNQRRLRASGSHNGPLSACIGVSDQGVDFLPLGHRRRWGPSFPPPGLFLWRLCALWLPFFFQRAKIVARRKLLGADNG